MKTLFLVLLSMVLSSLHAEEIDLQGGQIEREAHCTYNNKKLICLYIRKGDKLYKVYTDEKGKRAIYWLSPKGDILIYSRSST